MPKLNIYMLKYKNLGEGQKSHVYNQQSTKQNTELEEVHQKSDRCTHPLRG